MDWKQELGADIERARRKKGLSQEELGVKANFHKNTIGLYERGERAPDFDLLRRLAEALGRDHFDAGENMRIDFSRNGNYAPEPAAQQMELQFDQKKGASVRIESVEGGILIRRVPA